MKGNKVMQNNLFTDACEYIGLTTDEADLMKGKLNSIIKIAMTTANRLIGYDVTPDDTNYILISNYVNTRVMLDLYGDSIAPGLIDYHLSRLSEMEEILRYTKKPV